VKYADHLVLLAKEETVLQAMIDRLIETGRYYGMEMIVEKTKAMKISRQPSPLQIMIDRKQPKNVRYFKYLGSMITTDARCTHEIKSRTATATAAFNKKTFHQQIGLKFKEKISKMLHLEHSFEWC
jgi:ribosomal protein RSM22 (predicted rRNA methylase)